MRILLGLKLFVFIHICKCRFQETWGGDEADVFRLEGSQVEGSKMGMNPPPGVFSRKDVILGDLDRDLAQECEFKGISGDS